MSYKILILALLLLVGVGLAGYFILLNNSPVPEVLSGDMSILPVETQIEPIEPVRLLFVGDMMFDRFVAKHIDQSGEDSLFKNVAGLFEGYDAVIGNLEGTITTNDSIAQVDRSILRFTFDPGIAGLLKKNSFDAVSLANNHSSDFYGDGFEQTVKFLSEQGIDYFGSGYNTGKLSTKLTVEDRELCLVGYHDLYTYDELPAINEISVIRPDCDYVIVMPHWGEEYEIKESPRQQQLARQFIDAGADLVIGSHPHVVQPVEVYNGRAIFYSLGNFIFDQYFSWDTEHGLAVAVEFNATSTVFTQIPISIKNAEASVASSTDKSRIILRTGMEELFVITN